VKDIVAFLGALTGPYPEITMPRLPATMGHSLMVDKQNRGIARIYDTKPELP